MKPVAWIVAPRAPVADPARGSERPVFRADVEGSSNLRAHVPPSRRSGGITYGAHRWSRPGACGRLVGGVVVRTAVAISMLFGISAVICASTFAEDRIFADGFEGASPPPATVNGAWRFTLDFAGQPRELVVLLHQRAGGDLVGYMLGGTPKRLVTGGTYSSGMLNLDLLFELPIGDRAAPGGDGGRRSRYG